jgi:hypothetical protein
MEVGFSASRASEGYSPIGVGFRYWDDCNGWNGMDDLPRTSAGGTLDYSFPGLEKVQAENFLKALLSMYDRHPVWTNSAPWYSEACRRLKLEHIRSLKVGLNASSMQEEGMHIRPHLEMAKPNPSIQPASNPKNSPQTSEGVIEMTY